MGHRANCNIATARPSTSGRKGAFSHERLRSRRLCQAALRTWRGSYKSPRKTRRGSPRRSTTSSARRPCRQSSGAPSTQDRLRHPQGSVRAVGPAAYGDQSAAALMIKGSVPAPGLRRSRIQAPYGDLGSRLRSSGRGTAGPPARADGWNSGWTRRTSRTSCFGLLVVVRGAGSRCSPLDRFPSAASAACRPDRRRRSTTPRPAGSPSWPRSGGGPNATSPMRMADQINAALERKRR